jgi:hypothetical protein
MCAAHGPGGFHCASRQARRMKGVAFGSSFETAEGQWTIVSLSPLDPSDVRQVVLMLTEKQERGRSAGGRC